MSNKKIKVTPDKQKNLSDITVLCADNKYTQEYIKQQGTSSILITREMFNRYREVQFDGAWNMMMDWEEAANDAELSPVSYWTILENYKELLGKFGMIDWEEIKKYKGENNGKNNI